MCGKTHLSLGLASAAIVNNGFKGIVVFLPFVILGSLLPDIDTEKRSLIKSSKLKIFFIATILMYLYLHQSNKVAQLGIVLTIIISLIYSFAKHRTISHSLLGMIALIFPISLISSTGAVWFTLGYITHLFSDSLTVSGIPLFYPLSKNTIGFKICKSSGTIDLMIRILSIFLIIYSFI